MVLHAVEEMVDDRREQAWGGVERRRSWADPGVILQLLGLMMGAFQMFIMVCGAMLAAYIFLRTSATSSEISNVTLNDKLIEIRAQVDGLNKKFDSRDEDVKRVVNDNIRQDGELKRLSDAVLSAEGKAEQALARATNAQIEAKSASK